MRVLRPSLPLQIMPTQAPCAVFGINQVAVPVESLLDELSRTMGIDPLNCVGETFWPSEEDPGGPDPHLQRGILATIDKAEASLLREVDRFRTLYENNRTKRLGIGIASAFKNVGAGKGRAEDAVLSSHWNRTVRCWPASPASTWARASAR